MIDHELYTRMLFVDAVVGVGFPHPQVGTDAVRGGLAHEKAGTSYEWDRSALDTLKLSTLQELYAGLKMYEVTNAH